MAERPAPRPILSFCAGLALAALCGFLAWFSFVFLTLKMNPALVGADYWAEVRDRAQENPAITSFLVLSVGGALLGFTRMARSLASFFRK
jgi:hypothetical protein